MNQVTSQLYQFRWKSPSRSGLSVYYSRGFSILYNGWLHWLHVKRREKGYAYTHQDLRSYAT